MKRYAMKLNLHLTTNRGIFIILFDHSNLQFILRNKIVENTENTIELSADLCNNG